MAESYSVQYEYYASQSGLLPKYAYSREQHEAFFYYRFIDQVYSDLQTAAIEYYTENSGLTPASSYTIGQHVDAYFNNLQYNSTWETLIKDEVLTLVNGTGTTSGLFTALFESTF